MTTTTVQSVNPAKGRSLARFGAILRERAWLILLCTLAGGAAGVLFFHKFPRPYTASATVRYEVERLNLLPLPEGQSQDIGLQLGNLKRMLLSREFLKRVAETQQLVAHPRFGRGGDADAAVAELTRRMTVQVPDQGDDVTVTVRDSDPGLAARLANALVDELMTQNARARQQTLADVSRKLEETLQRMQREFLEQVNQPRPAGESPPAGEPQTPSDELSALSELNHRLITAGVQRLQLSSEYAEAQRAGTNTETLLQLPMVQSSPGVAMARSNYLARQMEMEQVVQRYKEKHPKYIETQSELEGAWGSLERAVRAAVADLGQEVQRAEAEEAGLTKEYGELRTKLTEQTESRGTGETPTTLDTRGLAISQALHDQIMQRFKEITLAGDLLSSPLRVIDRAIPSRQPDGPDQYACAAFGLGGGFLVGILLCLGFGMGDTTLKTVDETELALSLPALGVVPRLKNTESEMAAAEGFRSLRTSISVQSKGKDPRVLMFTSTSPDEGKTFCALNFAVGLAQQGLRTVLIECDLRRPMAAPSLSSVKLDAPGVSDFLRASPAATEATRGSKRPESGLSFAEIRRKKVEGDEGEKPAVAPASTASLAVDRVLQRTEIHNLFFVAAGTPVSNPTELLARPRFEQMLAELLREFDRVVLDSAPVLGVSETLLLSSRVQGVCFVIRAGHTPRRAVLRAVEILRRANAPLLGLVLNGLAPGKSDPYGEQYYYHRSEGRGAGSSKA